MNSSRRAIYADYRQAVGRIGHVALFSTVGLMFFKPNLATVVPVSFHFDNASQLRGQPDFGFQLQNESVAEKEEAGGRVEHVDGAVRIPTASRTFMVANAVILVGVLFAVLKTLTDSNPFVADNARRIRFVALAAIAGELARTAIVFGESYYASTHVAIAGITFDVWPRLNFYTLICGFILFVIAEVFRAGMRLDEEHSLTI